MMRRWRFGLLICILALIGMHMGSVAAQTCPVGTRCTPTPIPPAPAEPAQPPANPDDSDGDGTVDVLDDCPTSGGPAQNKGCPIEDTVTEEATATPPPIILPVIPPDGPCTLATTGTSNVNIRQTPELNAPILGQLNPTLTYPLLQKLVISLPDENIWYLTSGGWVFAGVVRTDGDCSNVPVLLQRNSTGEAGGSTEGSDWPVREVILSPLNEVDPLEPFYLQQCENTSISMFFEAQTITQCDNDVYVYDATEQIFECNGEIIEDMSLPNDCNERESQQLAIQDEGGRVSGLFLFAGYGIAGFNPQPEPPEGANSCLTEFGFPESEDDTGFNPAPPPPSENPLRPVCMLLANDSNFGGEGNPALLVPTNAGSALLLSASDGFGPGGIIIYGSGSSGAIGANIGVSQLQKGMFNINAAPGSEPLLSLLTMPPADSNWTEILLSNGTSLLVGEGNGSSFICPGSELSFNPQPEPPALDPDSEGESTGPILNGIVIVGFNPQPEPPALDPNADSESSDPVFAGISVVGFNPQPEPPARDPNADSESSDPVFAGISIVGFNPQPEPPALCLEVGAGT